MRGIDGERGAAIMDGAFNFFSWVSSCWIADIDGIDGWANFKGEVGRRSGGGEWLSEGKIRFK